MILCPPSLLRLLNDEPPAEPCANCGGLPPYFPPEEAVLLPSLHRLVMEPSSRLSKSQVEEIEKCVNVNAPAVGTSFAGTIAIARKNAEER